MTKRYAPPIPDSALHRPSDIAYFRELITAAGLSQRAAARALGIDERTLRYKLTSDNGSGRKINPLTYPEQFALEKLADQNTGASMNTVHETAPTPYGSKRPPTATSWYRSSDRPLTDSDAGKIVIGKDKFGAWVNGTLIRDHFGLVIEELHAQPVDSHKIPIEKVVLYTLLDQPK